MSKLLSVAICAAGLNLAAEPTALAGNEALVDESAQLRVWVGPDKPPFVLEDINGRRVRLEFSDDLITVVHFFATWCEPCRAELPSLDRLIARSDPSRLRVLAISVAEVDVRVRSFIDKYFVNVRILLDRDRSVARHWKVHTLPTTFVLDRNLRPKLFIEREYDWDRFDVSNAARAMRAGKDVSAAADPTAVPNPTTTHLRGGQP